MGRDSAGLYSVLGQRNFNPRARVGRDLRYLRRKSLCIDFNPRARVGRDLVLPDRRRRIGISIHAPAWGATRHNAFCRRLVSISIHAPRVGRDGNCGKGICKIAISIHAPRVGRDLGSLLPCDARDISIHAPAWGATRQQHLRRACHNGFQSTRPRGARPGARQVWRTGSDISIHAPAWGATKRLARPAARVAISIHAPAWGATCERRCTSGSSAHFNPRARVGRDLSAADRQDVPKISIHAPAWGATCTEGIRTC